MLGPDPKETLCTVVTWTENIEGGQQTDKDKQLDLHKAGREDVRMVRERQADTIKKEKEGGDCVANSTSYEINFILFFFFGCAVEEK